MRGGGRGPTEAYAAYAAGRAEVANEADGPVSAAASGYSATQMRLRPVRFA
jgi:hypothetical protein